MLKAEDDDLAPPAFWAVLGADLRHLVDPGPLPSRRWRLEVAVRLLLVPRIRAVCLFRLSQVAASRGLPFLALALQGRALRASGAEISPSATIGPGLCLMHSAGIVIGPAVRVGAGARIYQGVTLGDGRRPGQPTIGDHVTIGAGACVLGPVTIGDRVVIGAGAVVTTDVPDDGVAMGLKHGGWKPRRPGADPRLDALMSTHRLQVDGAERGEGGPRVSPHDA